MKSIHIFAALILLAACRPASESATSTSATEVTETVTDTAATETTMQTTGATPASVTVSLTEYRIDMPATLPAGPARFEVTNSGKVEHNFEIEGPGLEQKLPTTLKPGQSGTLEVDLKPGTYKVYCPVRDHDSKHGMSLQLTVN